MKGFVTTLFIILIIFSLFSLFHISKYPIRMTSIPINISVWGKSIKCREFYVALNLTGNISKYYLKKAELIDDGFILSEKDFNLPLNKTIYIKFKVKDMDRIPCDSVLRLTFYDLENKTFFNYLVVGC